MRCGCELLQHCFCLRSEFLSIVVRRFDITSNHCHSDIEMAHKHVFGLPSVASLAGVRLEQSNRFWQKFGSDKMFSSEASGGTHSRMETAEGAWLVTSAFA